MMFCWLKKTSIVCVCVCRAEYWHPPVTERKHAFLALVEHPCACLCVCVCLYLCACGLHICVCLCMYMHHETLLPNSLNLHYSARLEIVPSLLQRDEKMSGVPKNITETGKNEDGK